MREILFRGKRVADGQWVYGYYINTTEHWHDYGKHEAWIAVDTVQNGGWCNVRGKYAVDPDTVGQYTGLLDMNGKKIFEGDIVKCRHNWRLQVYPYDGIDVEKYFFEQKIRGAYGKYKHDSPYLWWGDEYFYFRNYAVEYYAPNGGFRVRNGGQFHALTSSYVSNRCLEIIGNIHDNPELLKGGE